MFIFLRKEHAKKHTMKSSMKTKRQIEEMMLIKGKYFIVVWQVFPLSMYSKQLRDYWIQTV